MKAIYSLSARIILVLFLGTAVFAPAAQPAAASTRNLLPPNPSESVASTILRCSNPGPLCQQLMLWMGSSEMVFEPEVLKVEFSLQLSPLGGTTRGESVAQLQALLQSTGNVMCEQLPGGVLHFSVGQPVASPDMAKVRITPDYRAASVLTLLGRMKIWSGREIHTDSLGAAYAGTIVLNEYDADSRKGNFSGVSTMSAKEIFAAARAKLERAGIALDELPDGNFRARLAAQPAPSAASTPAPKS